MLVEASFHTCVAIEPLKYAGPVSGGIKGGGGHGGIFPPPVGGSAPPLAPPPVRRKNGQNQPFSAIFLIFAPSETYFAPSMPPTENFLVPPLWSVKYTLHLEIVLIVKNKAVEF